MNTVHKRLEKRFSWYKLWHANPQHVVRHWMLFIAVALLLTTAVAVRLSNRPLPFFSHASTPSADPNQFFKLVDSTDNGYTYGYAPSIIKQDGVYHMFYCSTGANGAWDYIRYSSSTDGQNWSRPQIKLYARAYQGNDLAACDPSVVYFNGYYYMYYSSARLLSADVYQTVIQVARSQTINGSYATYTARGTWEVNPYDPKIIVYPWTQASAANSYGAGQQIVVNRNGQLYMWFTDDTAPSNTAHIAEQYFMKSSNPVQWDATQAVKIAIPAWSNSNDIKWDEQNQRFVMYKINGGHSATAFLEVGYSSDGISWEPFTTVYNHVQMPDFANNLGFSGDREGNIIPGQQLVAFGAPYDLISDISWGQWDVYGTWVNYGQPPYSSPYSTPPVGGDTQPPVISDIKASVARANVSVNINWITNEPADTQVEYYIPLLQRGTTLSPVNTKLTTKHNSNLTDIVSGMTYSYRVLSTDAAGNTAASDWKTFRTSPAIKDTK